MDRAAETIANVIGGTMFLAFVYLFLIEPILLAARIIFGA